MEVEVYRNLHKNVWSVRDKRTGRVIDHAERVVIRDARFIVQPAGRAKVLREQRKNVHAFVRGTYAGTYWRPYRSLGADKVSYNPYKAGHFTGPDGGKVSGAGVALLDEHGKVHIQD
jgi:hypothetical protein